MRSIEIVVLNWNGYRDTVRCLESLAVLEAPENAEIRVRVVDNGSTDGSADDLPGRFAWALFLANDRNLRYAGGNNVGIRAALEAGADFVLLLNNDTVAHPALARDLLSDADRHPGAGLFSPFITDAGGNLWFAGGEISTVLGATWHRGMGARPPDRGRSSRAVGYLTGCCLLVRREVFERVGLLDEGYYLYAEDADFCLRARAAGFECRVVPDARLTHFVSSSSGGSVNPFKAYQRTRAGVRLFSLHATGLARFTWRFGFVTVLALQSASWLLRGSPRSVVAAWRALVDVLRGRSAAEAFPVPTAALMRETR